MTLRTKVHKAKNNALLTKQPEEKELYHSRDYSKTKVKWSYELNKDLYNCYLESYHKTHGYMKRLKSLWDEKRPEYNQLSEKYLREQASRIIKKNLVFTNRQQSDTPSRRTNNQSTEYNEGWILN